MFSSGCRIELIQFITVHGRPGVGGLSKDLSGDEPLKWVAKSASLYNDDPLFSAKTGINMGIIFSFFF